MKNWIKIFIAFLLGLGICFFITKLFPKDKESEEIIVEKPVYIQDLITVHNLEKEIAQKNSEISILKSHVQEIKEVVIIEKEKIKTLPPDTGVVKLREFLEIYADTTCDTFPLLASDSLVLIDNDNLGNINSVFIDYFGAVDIMFDQEEIMYRDSIIISNLDSINSINTGIRENLETALTQERRKKNIWMSVGIGTTLTAIIIGVLSYGRSGN